MDIEVYDLYKRTYKCDERESIRFAPMISKIYLDSVKKQRDQYKAENEKLKEEVERLNGIIKDEEDWKAIEQEYEEWSDDNDKHS